MSFSSHFDPLVAEQAYHSLPPDYWEEEEALLPPEVLDTFRERLLKTQNKGFQKELLELGEGLTPALTVDLFEKSVGKIRAVSKRLGIDLPIPVKQKLTISRVARHVLLSSKSFDVKEVARDILLGLRLFNKEVWQEKTLSSIFSLYKAAQEEEEFDVKTLCDKRSIEMLCAIKELYLSGVGLESSELANRIVKIMDVETRTEALSIHRTVKGWQEMGIILIAFLPSEDTEENKLIHWFQSESGERRVSPLRRAIQWEANRYLPRNIHRTSGDCLNGLLRICDAAFPPFPQDRVYIYSRISDARREMKE